MNRSAVVALLAAVLAIGTAGCGHRRTVNRMQATPVVAPAPPPVSAVRFRNVAADAGLTYRWPSDGPRPRTILQTMGYGCAFLDYDNDGNLDILLIGPRLALYRGDGRGHFTDVTRQTGLDRLQGRFFGCAVGDYDNDGFPDIYLSGYQTGVLLHNEPQTRTVHSTTEAQRRRGGAEGFFTETRANGAAASPLSRERRRGDAEKNKQEENPRSSAFLRGQKRVFRDVTRQVGLTPQPWGTSCAWADLDGDGYLDLIVCNYVDYDKTKVQLCKQNGVMTACPPKNYAPLFAVVFRNIAGRRFIDETRRFFRSPASGNSLGVAVADADGVGRPDIALANDLRPGDLYRRMPGDDAFTNIGALSGTSTDSTGDLHAGMGVDWGDVNNDGKLDLFVTTYTRETKCLFRNLGKGLFEEDAHLVGIGTPTWDFVGFGCKFIDADNDGRLDLLIANGHTSDNSHEFSPFTYREPLQFFHNAGRRPLIFTNETSTFAVEPIPPIVGRGLAIGDYDNDGRMDALVVDAEGAPLLLHNETPRAGKWITLRLIGSGKSNRDAYGARITVTPETVKPVVAECRADGSYLSSSDARVHIGVGPATKVDVAVRWPDGREQTWPGLTTERFYRLREGDPAADY